MRLNRAIQDLVDGPDGPEPDDRFKRIMRLNGDGSNILEVPVGRDLTHCVMYDIIYDDDSKLSGVVRVKNVLDGHIFRLGFAGGDFRSD